MKNSKAILERSRNALIFQWEEMLRLRQLVLHGWGHEDIHDLRVASRRFRAALNLLGPLCASGDVRKVTKAVRRLTRALGTLRNLDEALVFFRSHAETASLSGLMGRLADMRRCEQKKATKALKTFRPKKLDVLVRDMAGGMVPDAMQRGLPQLTSYLSDTSMGLFGTIHTLLPATLRPEDREERHSLRIAIKKWRYFLEIVSRIAERNYDAVLERLKRYQSLLGSMNDMGVFSLLCREAAVEGDDRAVAEQTIIREHNRLFDAYLTLVEAEPLRYTFLA